MRRTRRGQDNVIADWMRISRKKDYATGDATDWM